MPKLLDHNSGEILNEATTYGAERTMADKEDLDFEISFYENLVKEKPDFVEALIPLGDAYTKRGQYKKGLEVDKRLVKLKPKNHLVHYNLACSYSLLKMVDQTLNALKKAIDLGYRDFAFMEADPDLENARKDNRYKDLVSKAKSAR